MTKVLPALDGPLVLSPLGTAKERSGTQCDFDSRKVLRRLLKSLSVFVEFLDYTRRASTCGSASSVFVHSLVGERLLLLLQRPESWELLCQYVILSHSTGCYQ